MTQKKISFQDYQTVLDAINFQKQDDKISVWQTVLIPLSGPKTIPKKTLKNSFARFFSLLFSLQFFPAKALTCSPIPVAAAYSLSIYLFTSKSCGL